MNLFQDAGVYRYQGEKTGHDLMFRAEYQTLRKLEKSSAIVFSIRTYQIHLEDFKKFPQNEAECLIKAIENLHPNFIEYKALSSWKEASLKYLRKNVLGLRDLEEKKWYYLGLTVGSVVILATAVAIVWKLRRVGQC